jgi:predicted nucleic acid-binding Zn ribbon protein
VKKLEQLIDKRSEYFRICPYCEIEFMADHMSTKFCSETCGDCYNNAKKRFNRNDSRGKELVSTADSKEPKLVDTTSPVKAFKGYPR